MRLNENEYLQFITIHHLLMYYVGQYTGTLSEDISIDEFSNMDFESKYSLRNLLYENIHLLDEFLDVNKDNLSEDQKKIIKNFKHFEKGTFYVMKYTKKHTLFLGENYVYAVHELSDSFEMILGNDLPIMIDAVLLPYKNIIIFDGMISGYNLRFGKGSRESLKSNLSLAQAKYGVITQLPVQVSKVEITPEKELLALMKTKSSREHNWYEIDELLVAHPALYPVFMREHGRINSRYKKKQLKKIGVKKQFYAMYDDTIIASSDSKKELEKKVKQIIPDREILNSIYFFNV